MIIVISSDILENQRNAFWIINLEYFDLNAANFYKY